MNQLLLRWKLDPQEEQQCLLINRVTFHTSRLLSSLNCPPVTTSSKASWGKEKNPAATPFLFYLPTKEYLIKAMTVQALPDTWEIFNQCVPPSKSKQEMTNIKILMILCNYDGSFVISNEYTLHINSNVFGSNSPLEGNDFYQMSLRMNEFEEKDYST